MAYPNLLEFNAKNDYVWIYPNLSSGGETNCKGQVYSSVRLPKNSSGIQEGLAMARKTMKCSKLTDENTLWMCSSIIISTIP